MSLVHEIAETFLSLGYLSVLDLPIGEVVRTPEADPVEARSERDAAAAPHGSGKVKV